MIATRRHTRTGFTIVELLVVISVIIVLLGLLLPSLAGARRRGKKLDEINAIRQVGVAWNLYANANRDAALPGYLDEPVQEAWRLVATLPDGSETSAFKYPDKEPISPEYTGPWTWRLMPYMNYNDQLIHGHLDSELEGPLAMSLESYVDENGVTVVVDHPREIAFEPGFGYNAFHVGGWWTLDGDGNARPAFDRVEFYDENKSSAGAGWSRTNVVSRSPSSIRNADKLIIFCSSALAEPGDYFRTDDGGPGSHYVSAPIHLDARMWRAHPDSDAQIRVEQAGAIPIGRYTGQVASLHADLHTQPYEPGVLDDQRYWIDAADSKFFEFRIQP